MNSIEGGYQHRGASAPEHDLKGAHSNNLLQSPRYPSYGPDCVHSLAASNDMMISNFAFHISFLCPRGLSCALLSFLINLYQISGLCSVYLLYVT